MPRFWLGEVGWCVVSRRGPEACHGLSVLPLLLIILPKSPNGFQALKLWRAVKPVCFLEGLINGRKSRP